MEFEQLIRSSLCRSGVLALASATFEIEYPMQLDMDHIVGEVKKTKFFQVFVHIWVRLP